MSTTPARNFGVQSYCFRNTKDNAAVAAKVKEIGLSKIEICGIHADFNDPESFKEVVQTYNDAGVSICSIGVETFVGCDDERKKFECAAAAGAKHISAHFRIDSFMQAVPKVRQWSEEFGIRVGIHCHGGYMFGGSPDVLEYLIKLGGPQIGLCIDTAWCMQIGPNQGKPIQWAEKFAGHIYGVHYKDFTFGKDGKWTDVVVGTGNLDLPGFVKALENGGFEGMTVIEYEGDPEDPVPALKDCVASMRAAT
ncbi:sugar phosphate isomerase/epimerase family protein [Cerasicoccus fimbriatus]|uniref:sugar phosphate isomerase/epimerase family protein n=1 Tax=Cerasicoccus fimbriatus TaxID=3014554 RepID=UPI0022B2BE51|nr:sugar phosphate isomerase/epimerase [Cerasicoccus sp. TK19100]